MKILIKILFCLLPVLAFAAPDSGNMLSFDGIDDVATVTDSNGLNLVDLLSQEYTGESVLPDRGIKDRLMAGIETQSLNSQELISGYCALLYERFGTYEEVSRKMGLDRRTVKKHIDSFKKTD